MRGFVERSKARRDIDGDLTVLNMKFTRAILRRSYHVCQFTGYCSNGSKLRHIAALNESCVSPLYSFDVLTVLLGLATLIRIAQFALVKQKLLEVKNDHH